MEVVSSVIMVNGISFIYSAIYVYNQLMFYSEIADKLTYVRTGTKPSISEIKTTAEVGVNLMMFASQGQKTKKKNVNEVYKMTYYERLCDFINYLSVKRHERKQQRKKRLEERLQKHIKKLELIEDRKKQAGMEDKGYTRCGLCKFYTPPDVLLQNICKAVLLKANETKLENGMKKYSPEQLVELQQLILNSDRKKVHEVSEFDRFRELFLYVDVKCGNCQHTHRHHMDEIDEPLYSPANIIKLHDKVKKMVYHNELILAVEFDIVKH